MVKLCRFLLLLAVFCLTLSAVGQVPQWRDMYKVKKKDTIYGIAKKYGLTEAQLRAANPQMQAEGYSLKKGDRLCIPWPSTAPTSQRATTTPASAKPQQRGLSTIRVGIMLPLHNVNGDGRRMKEYYRGFLMACDSLKRGVEHRHPCLERHHRRRHQQVYKRPRCGPLRHHFRSPLYPPGARSCRVL